MRTTFVKLIFVVSFAFLAFKVCANPSIPFTLVREIEGYPLEVPVLITLDGNVDSTNIKLEFDLKNLQEVVNKIINELELRDIHHTGTQLFGLGGDRLRIKAHFDTSGTRGSLEIFLKVTVANNTFRSEVLRTKVNISNDIARAVANLTGISSSIEGQVTNSFNEALKDTFYLVALPKYIPFKTFEISKIDFSGELNNLKAEVDGVVQF